MACNCGKGGDAAEFEVTLPSGEKKIAKSDVQARQWIARAGGGTMRRVPAAA